MIKLLDNSVIKISVLGKPTKVSLFWRFLNKINWIDIDQEHSDISYYYMKKQ